MSVAETTTRTESMGLGGASLLVPSLQSEPLPITPIKPAPCTQKCPAGINVKAYVSLIAEHRFAEALEVIRRHCPLPGICGRICHHPCEMACLRKTVDEPIAIRSLKRFVADLERDLPTPDSPPAPERSAKIAIVGSGPAGLTAAWDLSLAGYPVTIFEADTEPGGMLRYGITEYRLPRDVIDFEIDYLCRNGVDIETGCKVGVDLALEELMERGYMATLFAVGAQLGRPLRVPGEEDCDQVEDALAFLRRVNDGDRTPVKGKVVVIGGGSTAVEAARSALRLGAESVDILYRRYREELLADEEEIHAAEAEGIAFRFLVAPTRAITNDGRLEALECVRVGLGEPDDSGRRSPIQIPGSEFTVAADRVLAAVGQKADLDFIPDEFQERMTEWGLLKADPETALTSMQGVFAAGDAVSGPATVVEAIGGAHRAAESIRHYLEEGQASIDSKRPERRAAVEYGLPDTSPLEAMRVRPDLIMPKRGREFREVEKTFGEVDAVSEARRCLRCGPCGECRICAPTCRRRHIMVRSTKDNGDSTGTSVLLRAPGSIAMSLSASRAASGKLLPTAQPRQLVEIGSSEGSPVEILPVRARIVEELCRGCSLCIEVCPFEAISLTEGNGTPAKAKIEPALCRGCNLCNGVCPTEAAVPTALSPEWWGSRLEDAFNQDSSVAVETEPYVVLACQRRAGSVEEALLRHGVRVEVIRFRCVGQVDAGMLLDLYRHGARGILVGGCLSERCRFGSGAELAAEQVERAQRMLGLMGEDASRIWSDWSVDRAADPLNVSVLKMVTETLEPEASRRAVS